MQSSFVGVLAKALCLVVFTVLGCFFFVGFIGQQSEWLQVVAIFAFLFLFLIVWGYLTIYDVKSASRTVLSRAKADDLRREIAKSRNLEEQKKMAYKAALLVYGSADPLKLNKGDVVGVINNDYFVFRPRGGKKLKSVCAQCVAKMMDESYSHSKLAKHRVDGQVIAGGPLSARDYADVKLSLLRMGNSRVWTQQTTKGFIVGQHADKYTGAPVPCEIFHACSLKAK